ncbi:long-chain-fatty-acid--CoA ligase [Ferroglobus placidus]
MRFIRGLDSTMNDDYQLNLISILKHAALRFGKRRVVSKRGEEKKVTTYRDVYEDVKRLANALESLGFSAKDRIGVLSWNTLEFYELFFAVPSIGAVLLELNLRLHPEEISYVANHSEAKLIFVDSQAKEIAEKIAPKVKAKFVGIGCEDFDYTYEELLKLGDKNYEFPVIDERSACISCYTSGTTGKPKGVYYSHRAVFLHTLAVAINFSLSHRDTYLQLVPMFHANGWGIFFSATLTGAKLVFPGRYSIEKIGEVVDLIREEGVTVTAAAPSVLIPMLNYLQKENISLPNLRIFTGASAPPLSLLKGMKERGIEVIHTYGATETTPVVCVNHVIPEVEEELEEEELWELKRKQGLPMFGVEVKLMKNGIELPWDGSSVGELYMRGHWVAKSYYKDERSKDAFENGWWKSGDAATIDENGYVKIVDRFKDLIKSGGEWISSVDLENYLMAHPAVLEACVVGVPHPKWEERPLAFVVLKEEYKGKVSKEELYEHLKKRFAKWQLPDEILFVSEIPKTSVGKFNKRFLKEKYRDFYTTRNL